MEGDGWLTEIGEDDDEVVVAMRGLRLRHWTQERKGKEGNKTWTSEGIYILFSFLGL